MKMFLDRTVLILVVLLLATLAAFLAGLFPYPFGFLILTVFIVARVLYLRGQDR